MMIDPGKPWKDGNGISGKFLNENVVRDISSPDTVSMGNHPHGGGADGEGGWSIPLPCLLRFIENPSPWNTPASPISPQRRLAKRCTAVPPPGIRSWRGSLNPGCGREPGKPLLKKDR